MICIHNIEITLKFIMRPHNGAVEPQVVFQSDIDSQQLQDFVRSCDKTSDIDTDTKHDPFSQLFYVAREKKLRNLLVVLP